MTDHWEHFEHEADIGVRGIATTLAGAFEQAATAMTGVITDISTVQPREPVAIECTGPDAEFLLVDWLNALIFEMATRKFLFSRFEVSIEGEQLHGRAWGEAVDIARHQPAVEIKGATFTELRVTQTADRHWLAQCVIDV
ncbi:MAG: archease [Pseudomonadota bacterium]